jgi:hypothetical protein
LSFCFLSKSFGIITIDLSVCKCRSVLKTRSSFLLWTSDRFFSHPHTQTKIKKRKKQLLSPSEAPMTLTRNKKSSKISRTLTSREEVKIYVESLISAATFFNVTIERHQHLLSVVNNISKKFEIIFSIM